MEATSGSTYAWTSSFAIYALIVHNADPDKDGTPNNRVTAWIRGQWSLDAVPVSASYTPDGDGVMIRAKGVYNKQPALVDVAIAPRSENEPWPLYARFVVHAANADGSPGALLKTSPLIRLFQCEITPP